jgi:hypothetical protein
MKSKLFISPFTYQVIFDDTLEELTGNEGNTSTSQQIIIVDSSKALDRQADTLFHEASHGIWNQTILGNKFYDDQEELVISQMTPRYIAFIRDNPWAIKFILGR